MTNFTSHLLTLTSSTHAEEIQIIQSLWSGYGQISRYRLQGGDRKTVVVKCISLQAANEHPRGWNTDKSHKRKVRSYEVETHWYQHYNQTCNEDCRVPQYLGSYTEDQKQWIVLEDLDLHFPARKQHLNFNEAKLCLKWLAHFHATFLSQTPIGLWDIGTYWHLDTRPDEFKKIQHPDLKSKAHIIDDRLNNASYQTFVHGDAKVANFCFSEDEKKVAALDFQYVGGGCGVKDVAYLLGSCLTSEECDLYESDLLTYYFTELKLACTTHQPQIDFNSLEKEWRSLYSFAIADFTRFLLGWMPAHQKVNHYHLAHLNEILSSI